MKILITYGSNSGSTFSGAEYIDAYIRQRHPLYSTQLTAVNDLDMASLPDFNFVFFGTNTWFYNGKEGMPHIWYLEQEKALRSIVKGVRCGLFAMGDSSYAQFCQSADYLYQLLRDEGAELHDHILRFDNYFSAEAHNREVLEDWVLELLG